MNRVTVSSDRVLADTNVWISFFRGQRASHEEQVAADALDRLLSEDRVVVCGVVEMELLQGAKEDEQEQLELHLSSLPFLDVDRQDFREAGRILRSLRARGRTIPQSDALIAALCMRHTLPLLENDKHFSGIDGLTRHPWRDDLR